YWIALYDQELNYVNSWYQWSRDYELRDITPGNYFVSLHASYGYVDEVFDDIHCTPECNIGAGTPITVLAGATTGAIDFTLEPWGRIGGVLTASESGYPLSGRVEVYDSSGDYMLWTPSGESGDWLAGGLGDGTYFTIADADERLAEVWDGLPCEPECDPTAGTPIPTAIGTLTEGIDFSLGLGGWISGTVTRRVNGTPIEYVHVRVFDEAGEVVAGTVSGPLGRFVAKGLPSGTYTAVASEDSSYEYDEYACQVFDDLPCEGAEGTPIAVASGAETGGVDFALRRLGSISGRVTSAATDEALRGSVNVFDSEGRFVRSRQLSGGRYRVAALEPGTYFVSTYADDGYQNEVWDDIPCDSTACDVTTGTPVLVAYDQEVTDLNFALMRRGSLSGSVTETGSGQAIPDAQVYVYDSVGSFVRSGKPNSAGAFVVAALPAGTYFVKVLSSNHFDELYDNIPCESSCSITGGTPVPIEVGQDSSGVDFVLDRRGSISGRVTDESTGYGIYYAQVLLYSAAGNYLHNTYSSGTGEYTFIGLGSGTYFVRASSDGYTAELYDDIPCPYSCDVTSGVPITVEDGQDTSGIDLALAPSESGGLVKGRVVGFDGLGLPSVSVRLYNTAGSQVTSTTTDGLGYYQSPNLSNGSYFVVAGSTTHLDELYDNVPCEGGCDVTTGTAVAVSSGAVTENINFALDPTGRILGRLLDAVSGRPLDGGWVTIYDGAGVPVAGGLAGGDGHYSAWGLVTGNYFAVAKFPGYVSELFENIPCPVTCDVTTGQPVAVTAGQPTSGIDFSLTPYGGVAGRVTSRSTNFGLAGAVTLHTETGAYVGTQNLTENGYYFFGVSTAGTYFVTAESDGYIGQLYAGRECEPSCDVTVGTPVVVTNGVITNDVNFSLRRPYFADVPVEYWSRRYIESLYAAGVTAGCSVDPPLYCPEVTVSRAQAAPLLLRSDEGSGYVPPPAVGVFDDVPVESGFAPWIEELALREITAGCSVDPPLYCPEVALTRAQVAVFVLRTVEGAGYEPPAAVGVFDDVPVEDPFAPWIEEIARRGITAGCSAVPPLYCPGEAVRRDQIAVFLVKAFALPPAL
ncbi:MAG: MSCRAMM family protein, partial [Acidobacteriota bacterium]